MRLTTKPGDGVIFSHPENGYDSDQQQCVLHKLVQGKRYTVERLSVGSFTSAVELKERRGHHFNTVHFENA